MDTSIILFLLVYFSVTLIAPLGLLTIGLLLAMEMIQGWVKK